MPTLLIGKQPIVFLTVYFVINFITIIINNQVPVAVTKIVPYNYIGQYSALRQVLHTIGTAIGSGSVIFMLDCLGGYATLSIMGAFQLISGFFYYIYMKNQATSKQN